MLLLVWAGPSPDLKAGPAPVWPREKKRETGRGINFPLPSSCMQQDYACRRRTFFFKNKTMQGKRTLPGVEEAVVGGAAVAWLAYGCSGWCCGGSNGGERDFSTILCFRFVFSFCFRSVQVFPFCFSLSSLFLFVWFLLASLSFVLSLLPFGFFSSPCPLRFLSLFIGEKV